MCELSMGAMGAMWLHDHTFVPYLPQTVDV